MIKRLLTFATHKIYNLPVLVFMPHSRCNCRCVMCDIWKANHDKKEISKETLEKHLVQFKKLGVREVVFSGGEALMHSNLWSLCSLLQAENIKITLLSTGLLLEKNAREIIEYVDQVIVSIDGSAMIHDKIRNIPKAFEKLVAGISELKSLNSSFRVTARCVLQRYNFFDFDNILRAAKEIRLDQISFLAADVSTAAFNRSGPWSKERISEIALTSAEALSFKQILEESFIEFKEYYDSGFIAENQKRMLKIANYYLAINNVGEFPAVSCNAPWVSAVIESDGNVMPCFFHKAYGNIYDHDFLDIINSPEAISFRKHLNVENDPICKKCVCSLKLGITKMN